MHGHELLTPRKWAAPIALAIAAGVPGLSLMEAAGRAVADEAIDLVARKGAAIAVLCGPGNNGGDGFVAARLLREQGYRVRVGLLGPRERLTGDAAAVADRWGADVETLTPATLDGADLIIDALFGAGLSRPLDGIAAEVVGRHQRIGQAGAGRRRAERARRHHGRCDGAVVQATRTVTFFRMKPGHLLLPGRLLCGEVRLADIGIPESVLEEVSPRTFANGPVLWRAAYAAPGLDAHKYTRGHAVVVSGPAESTGAARLGARGALRIGAGLVTLSAAAPPTAINATHCTAVMVRAIARTARLPIFCRTSVAMPFSSVRAPGLLRRLRQAS